MSRLNIWNEKDIINKISIYPLEGIWKQKNVDTESAAGKLIKENLEYTIMIRQPDFITAEMVRAALERVKIKKPNRLYEDIIFDTIHDGKCVEILHTGSYDNEPISRLSGSVKPAIIQTLRAGARGRAGRHTLEGRLRGAFSGGEIQRLRRLRQEGHTPTVLVAVSD